MKVDDRMVNCISFYSSRFFELFLISGNTRCVNALNWAQDGELLISSGDDTKYVCSILDSDVSIIL